MFYTLLTTAANIGRNIVAVAVLLVNSVKRHMMVVTMILISSGDSTDNALNWVAIQYDNPDT